MRVHNIAFEMWDPIIDTKNYSMLSGLEPDSSSPDLSSQEPSAKNIQRHCTLRVKPHQPISQHCLTISREHVVRHG